MSFNIGDVVQLKSGGPPMTVTGVGETSSTYGKRKCVECNWYNPHGVNGGDYTSVTFPEDAVTLYVPCQADPAYIPPWKQSRDNDIPF